MGRRWKTVGDEPVEGRGGVQPLSFILPPCLTSFVAGDGIDCALSSPDASFPIQIPKGLHP